MSLSALSLAEARRIALAAQGLAPASSRAGTASRRQLAAMIRHLQLLQIDSVNVLVRSHYLPLFTRLGAYDRALLDSHTHEPGRQRGCFEYWAHEASFLPLDTHPLLRWRMQDARKGVGLYGSLARFAREKRGFLKQVLARLAAEGPLTAREIAGPGKRTGPWWGWHDGKMALEYLFWTGEVTAAARRGFERVYDLPERLIPREILAKPDPDRSDAMRALVLRSATALGVASEADLRDYFRLPLADARQAVRELVEDGALIPASVEGWRQEAYLPKGQVLPRKQFSGTALVSPFDPLVWNRPRSERLFGFTYRLELYTPAPKRVHGYYVLPVLAEGGFAGRVCLKADRQAGTLRVNAAWPEPAADMAHLADGLAQELRRLAGWLGLDRIKIAPKGPLARPLAAQLKP